jgi:hypothetical protein
MSRVEKEAIGKAFFIALALGILFSLFSCSRTPGPGTTIRIGIATWPGFASGMVGKEKASLMA